MKIFLKFQPIIGIHEKNIIPLSFSQIVGLRTVSAEIFPTALMQFAWNLFQMFLDDQLGSIGRSCVNNHEVINVRLESIQTPFDDMGLIFHDHVKTNGLFCFKTKAQKRKKQEKGTHRIQLVVELYRRKLYT